MTGGALLESSPAVYSHSPCLPALIVSHHSKGLSSISKHSNVSGYIHLVLPYSLLENRSGGDFISVDLDF